MNLFEFVTSPCIIFGIGSLGSGIKATSDFGKKALLIHATTGSPIEPLLDMLKEENIAFEEFLVDHEPSVELVQQMVNFARGKACDFVIGFGGGSVLDAGKATSAMLTNLGELLNYLEVVGQNQPLTKPAAPCVAIPTTAGTGAEVTRNAVLAVHEKKVKVSLRSNYLIPRLAIIDPQLTISLPPSVTAFTGLDALTQVIEPYVSLKNNPLMDVICRDGITRSARSLERAFLNGNDTNVRIDLSLTSLYGGLALTNAGLGAVHGFAASVGGMYDVPHGAICGILLPEVFKININALKQRAPDSEVLLRYSEVSRLLTGDQNATAEQGAIWLSELVGRLQIPRLSAYDIPRDDFVLIAEKAQKASSMKANPIVLTTEELINILEAAY